MHSSRSTVLVAMVLSTFVGSAAYAEKYLCTPSVRYHQMPNNALGTKSKVSFDGCTNQTMKLNTDFEKGSASQFWNCNKGLILSIRTPIQMLHTANLEGIEASLKVIEGGREKSWERALPIHTSTVYITGSSTNKFIVSFTIGKPSPFGASSENYTVSCEKMD